VFRRRVQVRILLITLLALLALAAPAAASPTQTVTFEAPRDLLDAERRDAALRELDSLGVRALRVVLYWNTVAPGRDSTQRPAFDATDPAAYDWGQYDPLIAAAAQRGWSVHVTLSGPAPTWATAARRDKVTRPDARAFRDFALAAGRRYGDQVDLWSIWNEPNHPGFLRPQFARGGRAISPRLYRKLFQAGHDGLRTAGQTRDRIVFGETAPRGTGSVVAPLRFLRETLCLDRRYRRQSGRRCRALDADGYAHHAYTTRLGPFFRPPQRDHVTIGVLGRLNRALDRAARARAIRRGLPIYLTEFGIQSDPPDDLLGVPLRQQPEYYAISERIARGNRRVASFSQYLLRDDNATGRGQYGGFESGLRFANGRAKPALAGFRLPLAVRRRGRGVSIWGMVRPATRPAVVELQVADRGGHYRRLRNVRTDARGSFTARGSDRRGRRWRLRWTAPDGTRFTGPSIRAYR
jgi:hypothetical protein